MRDDEFIGRVEYQAGLPATADADRACGATLATLSEWLPAELADSIAVQLPPRQRRRLQPEPGAAPLGRAGFVSRVAARADLSEDQAAQVTRAVLDAITAAIEGGLMARVTDSLPAELREYVTPPPGQEWWQRGTGWTGPVVGHGQP